ncbi:MAG: hypothetical protein R8K49_01440 [Mariprofundaceae bacterium]
MMKNYKLLWLMIAFLVLALLGIGVKFIVLGQTSASDDGRTQVLLDGHERQLVLSEMRQLLAATQQVTEGLANQNLAQVATAASEVGMQATSTMDVRLKAKLPLDFKKLGFATHQGFDDIASLANSKADARKIQLKLAETMNLCLACHASYQLPSIKIEGE